MTEIASIFESYAINYMDITYKGDETRKLFLAFIPSLVVPPKNSLTSLWKYEKELYKKRNEVYPVIQEAEGLPPYLH